MALEYDERIPGSLSQLYLEEDVRENLLDYMSKTNPSSYTDFIWSMMGDDKFLMFFDVLEGLTIKVPSRQNMARIVGNVQIYTYLKSRNATPDAYEKASHIFKKRVTALEKIYSLVDSRINGDCTEEPDDEEDINDD